MNKDLKKIAEHYGLVHQLEKQIEELKELEEATADLLKIAKSASFATPTGQQKLVHYCEEVADVQIMIEQNQHLLGGDYKASVKKWTNFKIARQLHRIEGEKNND